MSADTVVAAVGTFFAAVAALVSSRYAKQSSEAGRDAVEELERSRLLAERERRREHVIRVGELIEQLVPFVWRQCPRISTSRNGKGARSCFGNRSWASDKTS